MGLKNILKWRSRVSDSTYQSVEEVAMVIADPIARVRLLKDLNLEEKAEQAAYTALRESMDRGNLGFLEPEVAFHDMGYTLSRDEVLPWIQKNGHVASEHAPSQFFERYGIDSQHVMELKKERYERHINHLIDRLGSDSRHWNDMPSHRMTEPDKLEDVLGLNSEFTQPLLQKLLTAFLETSTIAIMRRNMFSHKVEGHHIDTFIEKYSLSHQRAYTAATDFLVDISEGKLAPYFEERSTDTLDVGYQKVEDALLILHQCSDYINITKEQEQAIASQYLLLGARYPDLAEQFASPSDWNEYVQKQTKERNVENLDRMFETYGQYENILDLQPNDPRIEEYRVTQFENALHNADFKYATILANDMDRADVHLFLQLAALETRKQ